ncbi:MAG TPA: energy transducer TonB [bacterium]|nr:energy transducer TonB [bacterium]
MGLSYSKRLAYAVAASLVLHFLILIAVFGGRGGRSGPLRMPGLLFVELISLGSKGAEARMAPGPTPFAQQFPAPERPDREPLPALDTECWKGREPVPDTRKTEAKKSSSQNPSGLREGEPLGPEISLPRVDLEAAPDRGGRNPGMDADGREAPLRPPQCAHCPAPRYPAQAQDRGLEGEVVLKVEVLADGRVGDVYVMTSSGFPILDDTALAAVKSWTFYPATRENVPAPTSQQIRVPFVLPAP